jgi:hypothetical protein
VCIKVCVPFVYFPLRESTILSIAVLKSSKQCKLVPLRIYLQECVLTFLDRQFFLSPHLTNKQRKQQKQTKEKTTHNRAFLEKLLDTKQLPKLDVHESMHHNTVL